VPRALLFDRDAAHEVDLADVGDDLERDSLLWVELDRSEQKELEHVARTFGIGADALETPSGRVPRAAVHDFRSHLHVTVVVPGSSSGDDVVQVDCLVGDTWLVTVSPREAEAIAEFRQRVTGRGELGGLDAPSFLAALLEWVIEGYLRAFDAIEEDLEEVDVAAMAAADDRMDDTLGDLVGLRRRTGRLRRALGDHRRVVSALVHPEFDAVSTEESAERFTAVLDRLDHALGVADAARDSVLGSFELMIARSGQRTNDIMKVLTLASVLLLPSTALAGVMGMNFRVGVFDHPALFWVVIGVMLLLATATLAAARLRRWI
jgi:magnesium transporter